MRKSHDGLIGVVKDAYVGLPKDLQKFSYYYNDGETGHVIMAVPECILPEAEKDGDLDEFECAIPVKYVLERGYGIYKDHVICDVDYDENIGLMIEEKYYEV